MYRRIEVHVTGHPPDRYSRWHGCDWGGVSQKMADMGMASPGAMMFQAGLKSLKRINHKAKFWWTERGWRDIGSKIAENIRRTGYPLRIKTIKHRDLDVCYQDKWQVAGLRRRNE